MTEKFFPDKQQAGAPSQSAPFLQSGEYGNIIRKARQTLTACVRGLDILSSTTEDEFILIGENLKNFSVHAPEIAESADAGAQNFEDIMTLIQFHDITRQQFERSSRVCRAMIDTLAPANNGKSRGAAKAETSSSALAGELVHFCLCEARAIADAREKFVSAVTNVVQKLETIAEDFAKTAGNSVAAEIETSVRDIRIHGFVAVVAEEVLSNLDEIIADIRQFVPLETWKRITAGTDSAPPANNDAARLQKGIFSKTENSLGDNVELF